MKRLSSTSPLLAAFLVTFSAGCREVTRVQGVNHAPEFGAVSTSVSHDVEYSQVIRVSDPDGDPVSVRAVLLPRWLGFDTSSLVLSGFPGVEAIGSHRVTLLASDGVAKDTLSFLLTVVANTESLHMDGPWVAAGFPFGHDGQPVRTRHFAVFSGFSGTESRRYVAEALEGHFQDLETILGITSNAQLDGWQDTTRIDVLSLRYQGTNVLWTGQSYRYGLIVHAPDSPRYTQEGYTLALYDQLLRHELMHVMEYYLVGRNGTYDSVEKWFHEGMATVMGGTPPNQILSVETLRQWQSDMAGYPGAGNPISIETGADYPSAIQANATQLGRYYMVFELAVRYLLDPDGGGKTPADVKALYLDIRGGASFPDAFQRHMGLDVDAYEAGFFFLMEQYLD